MGLTKHGHHIPGTVSHFDNPKNVARCGGIGSCVSCDKDVAEHAALIKENEQETTNDDVREVLEIVYDWIEWQTGPLPDIDELKASLEKAGYAKPEE